MDGYPPSTLVRVKPLKPHMKGDAEMRKRNKSIIIRLTEEELRHIDDMVENSYLDREDFLRKLLSGYTMVEVPKDYRKFNIALFQIASMLSHFDFNSSLEHMISDIYTPYYKEWQKKRGRKNNA